MRALARLSAAALAGGLVLILTLSAWSSPSGATPPDTTYTAVTPCVVFDSRATQDATGGFLGPINGGQAVTEQITGTFPAGQGGGAAGSTCGIPAGAALVEINIVAVNALNEGNLRVTDGSPTTSGGVVNFNNLTPKLNSANAVIVPLDATGHIVVTPNCGAGCTADSVDIRGVVLGYFTDALAIRTTATEATVAALQAEVDQLQALLAGVTRNAFGVGGQDTLQFSGMNVQIVDGTGSTECEDADGTPGDFEACNGRGNLIVGYAENNDLARTGAHNIVGGEYNSWSSFGGAVFGTNNRSANDFATVTGGWGNNASGPRSSVTGGRGNEAAGMSTSATGGSFNRAYGEESTVSGGTNNDANGEQSVVSAGYDNLASGSRSTVSGGSLNAATGRHSSVSGGLSNIANDADCNLVFAASSVSGGQSNVASGCAAAISGGRAGAATGTSSAISGGTDNFAYGENASISGGYSGAAIGLTSSISGGYDHTVNGPDDWQGGGLFQDS